MRKILVLSSVTVLVLSIGGSATAQKRHIVKTNDRIIAYAQSSPGTFKFTIGDRPIASYFFEDEKITRPYFANVHAPNGIQVTRNHPPEKGDLKDHATFHPGIWMAFGDISGNDYWRLRAKIRLAALVKRPKARFEGFRVQNNYYSKARNATVCEELCHIQIVPTNAGYLMLWDSEFKSQHGEFYFGDQEEMGLGVRVATPIAVNQKKGGKILNSNGLVNGAQVWGKQAKWCDYSGMVNGKGAGVTIMPHPDNFRASWFHARDYGLLLANPFGQRAFTHGKPSKVIVKKGESLRLRFGIFIHDGTPGAAYDPNIAYRFYLKFAGK